MEDRAVRLAEHMLKTRCTVRMAAEHFGISKSTVHKDLTERLKNIHKALYREVRQLLEENKAERHIRGGMATKRKYEKNNKEREGLR
ncbi:MAG: sporulation transcriptional regulator SpoIIID [Clostridia bacterium]|nr:sporulation transcriptional regulator SpoIIID [Clostridia bacterium]